jgi:hypothetical protein
MSFFDTLKQFGLWPQQGGQGGQPQANPYGLDDGQMRQARMQSLSNLGSQIMAASVQQTPRQRADLMSGFDMSGGYQDNLYNAAQQKLMSAKMRAAQKEEDQAEKIRISLANRLKSLPPGQLRDAAMWFYESGDYAKAGEILFKRERVFDPMTGQDILVDAFQTPIGAPPLAAGGGSPVPASGGGSVMPAPGGAPAPTGQLSVPAAAGGVPAMPAIQEPVDQLTINYRALTKDPSLTPQEARVLAGQGSKKGMWDAYQQILSQRQTAENAGRTADQTSLSNNRTAADALTDDFAATTKSYNTIIGAGQRAVQVAMDPSLGPAAKLTTLYQFMKALDPDGAVREGDVQMAQQMQAIKDQWLQWAEAQIRGGGPISQNMINDMAREMARLANDAKGRKEQKRIETVGIGRGRQIPDAMFDPTLGSENQNMPVPIGYNTESTGIVQPRVVDGKVMPPAAGQGPRQQWPRVTLDAARDLQGDPSPQGIAEFDDTFGPGAAARVLQGGGVGR